MLFGNPTHPLDTVFTPLSVDLGFGMDATQAACGKLLKSAFENMFEGSDDVKSNLSHHHEKHQNAKDSEAEGVPS